MPSSLFSLEGKNVAVVGAGSGIVRAVAAASGVAAPDVYVHPQSSGDVLWANARSAKDLARTIAIGSDLFQGRGARYLVAAIAKALAYSRPEYLLRMAASSNDQLEAIFLGAASLSRSDVPVPTHLAESVAQCRKHFTGSLSKAQKSKLADAVRRYVARGKAYDLASWCRHADRMSRRIALLVSGDFAATIEVGGGALSEAEVGEMLRHSVSDTHAAARERLGLAMD